MTTPPRKLTPQEETRLEQVRRNFQERRDISNKLDRIKTKIGVYSGKGGVGKTTVAVNLAVTLAEQGYAVALFDCDIDCPNVGRMMMVNRLPEQKKGVFTPVVSHGVKVMSMTFFQRNEEEATIWRGPMIHNAINQFTKLTEWGDLDYLVVDLPPGTSDAPLTVMQTLSIDGFVVVTTPQELAALDAKRSANMIRKLNLVTYGIVENMAGEVFGSGAGEELSDELELPFLGRFDMRTDYRSSKGPACLTSKPIKAEYELFTRQLINTHQRHALLVK